MGRLYTYMDGWFLYGFHVGKVNGFHTQSSHGFLHGIRHWFFFAFSDSALTSGGSNSAEVQSLLSPKRLAALRSFRIAIWVTCFQLNGWGYPPGIFHISHRKGIRKIIDSNMPYIRGIC